MHTLKEKKVVMVLLHTQKSLHKNQLFSGRYKTSHLNTKLHGFNIHKAKSGSTLYERKFRNLSQLELNLILAKTDRLNRKKGNQFFEQNNLKLKFVNTRITNFY